MLCLITLMSHGCFLMLKDQVGSFRFLNMPKEEAALVVLVVDDHWSYINIHALLILKQFWESGLSLLKGAYYLLRVQEFCLSHSVM